MTGRMRLVLAYPADEWRQTALSLGIREIPLTGDIGIRTVELEGLTRDPADRMITATAIAQGASLMTADSGILEWTGQLARQDARL